MFFYLLFLMFSRFMILAKKDVLLALSLTLMTFYRIIGFEYKHAIDALAYSKVR